MSVVNNISSSSTASVLPEATAAALPMKTLTQEDFLKLLVAKLGAQDPLNPTQDTEFISQMAQFSTLEQSKAMQSDLNKLLTQQAMTQAHGLLGRAVRLEDEAGGVASGTVSAVLVEEGRPKLIVNDQAYDLDQVVTITPGGK